MERLWMMGLGIGVVSLGGLVASACGPTPALPSGFGGNGDTGFLGSSVSTGAFGPASTGAFGPASTGAFGSTSTGAFGSASTGFSATGTTSSTSGVSTSSASTGVSASSTTVSASSAATTSASTGSGGSCSPGTPGTHNDPQCETCWGCAADGQCKPERIAFMQAPNAGVWLQCAEACPHDNPATPANEFQSCVATCNASYPGSESEYLAFLKCVACQTCATECNSVAYFGNCSEVVPF